MHLQGNTGVPCSLCPSLMMWRMIPIWPQASNLARCFLYGHMLPFWPYASISATCFHFGHMLPFWPSAAPGMRQLPSTDALAVRSWQTPPAICSRRVPAPSASICPSYLHQAAGTDHQPHLHQAAGTDHQPTPPDIETPGGLSSPVCWRWMPHLRPLSPSGWERVELQLAMARQLFPSPPPPLR